jgi:hypothetical protein
MEWFLIINLMGDGMEHPPKVLYPTHAVCEGAAQTISEQYD